jgi:dTDP-glucose 4,6-dehydratase
MSESRVLVTGAAGFLGSHLCDALLAEGSSVVGVDNLLTGRESNLQQLRNEPRFTFERADICEPFDFGRVSFVLDFASPASPIDYMTHGIATLRTGSVGTTNCLELARKYSAGFLLASTSECYGDPLEHPQSETYWGNVNPIGPRSVYDEAKRFSEAITMAYRRYHNVDTRIVRIFNTYGPRMQLHDGRVIPNFMRQALLGEDLTVYGDGSQTRSFCYVSDEIDGSAPRQYWKSDRIHHPRMCSTSARSYGFAKQDSLRGIAHRRSQAAPSEYPESEDSPRVGTENQPGDRSQTIA